MGMTIDEIQMEIMGNAFVTVAILYHCSALLVDDLELLLNEFLISASRFAAWYLCTFQTLTPHGHCLGLSSDSESRNEDPRNPLLPHAM